MKRILIALTFLLVSVPFARADVVESSAGGFTIKDTFTVAAPAVDAYRTVIDRIGTWWSSDHTYSGNAANLSIDPRPGGCWCEKLPSGGSVEHMRVVFMDPGKRLRFAGGLGPLQDMAAVGAMQFTFTEAAGQTSIEVTYKVGGYTPGGFEALAKGVDAVLAEQVARLKKTIETGKP